MLQSDYHAADRLLNYQRYPFIPQHQIKWNWIGSLPFGRGKLIGRNANGFLNALIGGWQLAGAGTWYSRFFNLPTGLYGDFSGVQIYGKHHQVLDCRGGGWNCGGPYMEGYITGKTCYKSTHSG